MNKSKLVLTILSCVILSACGSKQSSSSSESSTVISNGITTSTFKVWGNCEMCKETIEGSLKVEGINKAEWNVDSKMITVAYNTAIISLDQIQKNIAAVGYDNEKYKGDDKAYVELAGCCQYERK